MELDKSPFLSVIIVNWNGMSFLPDCLKSIGENPPIVPFEIVVVDNASSDGSAEWLLSDQAAQLVGDARLLVIKNDENVGFGAANNQAFEETESPLILLLNPDTIITDRSINQLVATLESAEVIGAVAPKLLNKDGSLQHSVWGGFPPTPFMVIIDGLKLHRLIPRRILATWLFGIHWSHDEKRPVPVVAGAAILIKRSMLNAVGGFDTDFHMYGEDLEWCLRITRGGWQIVFDPSAEVYHLGGRSSLQRWTKDEIGVVQESAHIMFQQKCISPRLALANSISKIVVYKVLQFRRFLRGSDRSNLSALVDLHWKNCLEILKHSWGSGG